MVSSTGRKIISLAISLLVVVISLTGIALGATAPTVTALTPYTPGLAGAPGKMTRDAAGNFYVADFWGKGIVKFDRQGGNKGFIPTSGRPTAVAVLTDNRLVVAMTAPQPKVAFYSQTGLLPNVTGEETGTFGIPVDPALALYRPIGITVDAAGYIYVLDSGDSSLDLTNKVAKVRVYESNGTYRYAIGARTLTYDKATTLDTRLKQPAGISYEKVGNKIVVADTMNGRLLLFSAYNGTSMSATSFIGTTAGGGGSGSVPSIGSIPVTFSNPVDVAFEYDAVPTLQRIYVAERARNEISVLDATTNLSTKYINATFVSGATLKFPNSLLFEKTAPGGVLYVSNAAADILPLTIDGGAIPGTGATLAINTINPTSTAAAISISGTNSGAFAVSCSVNNAAYVPASGTTIWSINNNPNIVNLVSGYNHIVCKTSDGAVDSFAEADTYLDPAPVNGPTVTIAGPSTSYSKVVSPIVNGTTSVANASVKVEGNHGGICTATSDASANWSCTLTLPEGINVLTASAWKTGTTIKTANATVVVDLTDPDMTVTGKISFVSDVDTEVAAPTTTNAVQNLDGIVFEANLSSVEVNGVAVPAGARVTLADNNTYFSAPVTLSRGLNTVTVKATDLAGRSYTLSRKVKLNPEIPGLTVALPADNSYRPAAGVATASGTVGATLTSVNAAGTAVTPAGGNWSTAAMTVAAGFNSYKFTASGAVVPVTEKRTINAAAAYAQLAITSPAADLATKNSSLVVSGSVAAGTVVAPTISVSGGATISDSIYTQGTGVFSHTVTFPAQGTYNVKVAADAATAAIRNIIYDANLPELTIQADTKPMPATITGAIEPNVRISAITATLNGTPVVIPLSVITFDAQASGSVVWHADLSGYVYDINTLKFTAVNPAGTEKLLTRKVGIPTGDIDNDGVVRLSDALAALRHVAGTETLLGNPKFQADVGSLVEGHAGQDDVVDITDAVLILGKSYGLLSF